MPDGARGLKVFDAQARALRAGRTAEATQDLLGALNMQRGEDKSLLVGYHNGHSLRGMEELVAQRGSLKALSGLVLVPFCLQDVGCEHKIVWDPDSCRRCCTCAVAPVEEFAEELGWPLRVCTRARLAPQFVEEVEPQLVISLACPHESFAEILSIRKALTYALLLSTPEGYCRNAHADLHELTELAAHLGHSWKPTGLPEAQP